MLSALFFVAAVATAPWGTGESRGEDLSIKIVTFGPGDDIAEWFGHAAIIVEDKRLKASRLYNYGEYSFDETMVRRYAMGHLEFSVGERPTERTLELYASHDRSIRLAELALSSAQKQRLAALLAENIKPENKRYLYDHYSDNCTTRLRDLLDVVVDGQLRAQVQPGTGTLRQLTRRQTAVSPAMGWLIDFILNDSTDQPLTTWEEAFLPDEFEEQLHRATIVEDGVARPLVQATSTWWKSTRGPLPEPRSNTAWLAIGVVAGGGLLLLRRRRWFGVGVVVVGGVFGAVGSALFFMATFTDHHVARGNENLLLASPLTLLLVPCGLLALLGKTRRPLRWASGVLALLAIIALALKVFPTFDQDNGRIIALLLPLWLAIAAGAASKPR